MMLKASFLAILLLGVYAAFAVGSIGHNDVALTAAVPLDLMSNLSPGLTNDTVNSAAKADRLPTAASFAETTTVAIKPDQPA